MCERTSYCIYVYVRGHWDIRTFCIVHGRWTFTPFIDIDNILPSMIPTSRSTPISSPSSPVVDSVGHWIPVDAQPSFFESNVSQFFRTQRMHRTMDPATRQCERGRRHARAAIPPSRDLEYQLRLV